MVRVMGKLETAAARANTRTEAMEDYGSVAGAGCYGIEWMRPKQPCAGERLPAYADCGGTPKLDAKLFSAAPLRLYLHLFARRFPGAALVLFPPICFTAPRRGRILSILTPFFAG